MPARRAFAKFAWGLARWLLLLLVPVLLVELALRVHQRVTLGVPIFRFGLRGQAGSGSDPNTPVTTDEWIGWRPSAGYRFDGEVRDADGSSRKIVVTQQEHGLRAYADPKAPGRKLLAVGDSFTQAVCVNDGETYYDLVGERAGLAVFGGGASGWGTLQEGLFVDELFDTIHPDLILWQFDYNDYMDNDYELGKRWRAGCQTLVRPYWENDRIVYRYSCHGAWATYSRIGYLITTRLDRLRAAAPGEDELLQEILREGHDHAGFRSAASRTSAIFDLVRARVGGVPVVVLDVGTTSEPFFSTTRELARSHGFHFVETLPAALDRARAEGLVVECEDRIHFNGAGHRIIAEAIEQQLAADKLLANAGQLR